MNKQEKERIIRIVDRIRNTINHLEITYKNNRTFVHKVGVLSQIDKLKLALEKYE
jgi:predicted transport protein